MIKYLALFLLGRWTVNKIKDDWNPLPKQIENLKESQEVVDLLSPKIVKGLRVFFTIIKLTVMLIIAYAILT